MNEKASSEFKYEKKYLEILGKKMAFVDEGQGDPTVFLHGNNRRSIINAEIKAIDEKSTKP